jgi:hypothetical protein
VPIVPVNSTQTPTDNLPQPRVRIRSRLVPPPGLQPSDETTDPPSASAGEYAVGYRRPPRHSQFKAGQSGNPKGRPKAAKGLNLIVRDTLTQKVAVRTASGERKISRIEAVLQKTVEQAMKGNPRALAELLKLYANAVPDQKHGAEHHEREEDLTATDLAMLEELRQMLSGGQEQGQ